MMVSTILVTLVQIVVWELRIVLPLAFCTFFLILEGVPAAALLYKVSISARKASCSSTVGVREQQILQSYTRSLRAPGKT